MNAFQKHLAETYDRTFCFGSVHVCFCNSGTQGCIYGTECCCYLAEPILGYRFIILWINIEVFLLFSISSFLYSAMAENNVQSNTLSYAAVAANNNIVREATMSQEELPPNDARNFR